MPPDQSNSEADRNLGLKLVDEASTSGASPNAGESDFDPGRSGRWVLPVWLFVLALIVFFLAIGWQAKVASELEAEVEGLERDLAHTTALLDRHRTHLEEIRGGVQELSARLAGLSTLVESDPAAPDDSAPVAAVPDILDPTP
jgi:hypothetical protein